MKVTLKDIAERAGVSIATVSRVINNDKNNPVSKDTRDKVWKLVKKMGYRVNNDKDSQKITKKIGYIINDKPELVEHPYFSEVIKGIEEETKKFGYEISFYYLKSDIEDMATRHKIIAEENADGLIIIANYLKKEIFQELENKFSRTIIIGYMSWENDTDMVFINGFKAVLDAVKYLINLGHEEIGFIGGEIFDYKSLEQEERFQGFKTAIKNAGLQLKEKYIMDGNWTIDGGYEAMKKVLKKGIYPTAIFGASDLMSIGAMRAIKEENLKIPEDISLVSFDNIQISQYTHPSLTTIHVPKKELGKVAVRKMIHRIEGESGLPEKIILPTKLIKRESVISL